MTSDKAQESLASRQLKMLEHGHFIRLGMLHEKEFVGFLEKWLAKVDADELRGFVPLGSLIRDKGSEPFSKQPIKLKTPGYCGSVVDPLTLASHVIKVCRGVMEMEQVYKRYESNETTRDYHVASSWGRNNFYIASSKEKILVLRRPRARFYTDENLFEVSYSLEKIPHKEEFKLTDVSAVRILPNHFRKYFGDKAPDLALHMIWELRDAHSKTLSALRSKANSAENALKAWETISNVLTT